MIYTITLNPALDHYVELDTLRVDDANRMRAECLYAGGKGIDVSRALHRLGGASIALGFIGGHNGALLTELLRREGITPHFTPIAQETRRDIIVNVRGARRQTMLNARGPLVSRREWRAFLEHLAALELRDAYVVMGGSLPRGLPPEAYRDIIRLVQRRGALAVLDADGRSLREGLRARPFAIKPNVNELRRLTHRRLSSEGALLRTAQALHRDGVEVVLVSRGGKGLMAVHGGGALSAMPPRVAVKSTVGAGDSCVAGFVLRHAGGKPFEDGVRYATAAGTAATLSPGNELCRREDVERIAPRVRLKELSLL